MSIVPEGDEGCNNDSLHRIGSLLASAAEQQAAGTAAKLATLCEHASAEEDEDAALRACATSSDSLEPCPVELAVGSSTEIEDVEVAAPLPAEVRSTRSVCLLHQGLLQAQHGMLCLACRGKLLGRARDQRPCLAVPPPHRQGVGESDAAGRKRSFHTIAGQDSLLGPGALKLTECGDCLASSSLVGLQVASRQWERALSCRAPIATVLRLPRLSTACAALLLASAASP